MAITAMSCSVESSGKMAAQVYECGMEHVEDSSTRGAPYARGDIQSVPALAAAGDAFGLDYLV